MGYKGQEPQGEGRRKGPRKTPKIEGKSNPMGAKHPLKNTHTHETGRHKTNHAHLPSKKKGAQEAGARVNQQPPMH